MAKNIYDLFNERKNGIDCLVEGLDPEIMDLEPYEDLEEAVEALDQISLESTNEMVEFQAAVYLEDLVLENMMYEDFDEEKIQNVMEAAKEEKSEGLKQKVQNLWNRIKEWFAKAFRTIANFFQSGETLVSKYKNQIPRAMQLCNAKIKMKPLVVDPEKGINQVNSMVGRLKAVGHTKEQILGLVGLNDKKDIGKKIDNIFHGGKEASEHNIKDMPVDIVIKYAGNRKIIIDGLKKSQKDIDGEFKECLANLKKGDGKNKSEEVANFQFGITVANDLLSGLIRKINQLSKACTAIIRKALSGKYDANKEEKPDVKVAADPKKGKGLLATPEGWEIIDEEENNDNNDDVEW